MILKNKLKKTGKVLLVLLISILIVLGILWNRFLNKNSLFTKFETSQQQEVFLLGTFHDFHFNKLARFSMEDIVSVIENVNPDIVFIEAREESFDKYEGVMDGPIDMAVAYAYCIENGIAVEMIDWWVVDNNYQNNSTTSLRDDMIFNNINSKLTYVEPEKTVLVLVGSGHFHEQSKRFLTNGLEKASISKKTTYFDCKQDKFSYPEGLEDIWEKRSYFYAYIYPEFIEKDKKLIDEIKLQFTAGNHDGFYNQQMEFNSLFENDELYK